MKYTIDSKTKKIIAVDSRDELNEVDEMLEEVWSLDKNEDHSTAIISNTRFKQETDAQMARNEIKRKLDVLVERKQYLTSIKQILNASAIEEELAKDVKGINPNREKVKSQLRAIYDSASLDVRLYVVDPRELISTLKDCSNLSNKEIYEFIALNIDKLHRKTVNDFIWDGLSIPIELWGDYSTDLDRLKKEQENAINKMMKEKLQDVIRHRRNNPLSKNMLESYKTAQDVMPASIPTSDFSFEEKVQLSMQDKQNNILIDELKNLKKFGLEIGTYMITDTPAWRIAYVFEKVGITNMDVILDACKDAPSKLAKCKNKLSMMSNESIYDRYCSPEEIYVAEVLGISLEDMFNIFSYRENSDDIKLIEVEYRIKRKELLKKVILKHDNMQATPSVDQNDERQENMPENYDENLPTNIEEDNRAQYLKIIPKDKTNDKRIKARFTSVIRKLKNKLKKKELEK